jgi:hypothetical protein
VHMIDVGGGPRQLRHRPATTHARPIGERPQFSESISRRVALQIRIRFLVATTSCKDENHRSIDTAHPARACFCQASRGFLGFALSRRHSMTTLKLLSAGSLRPCLHPPRWLARAAQTGGGPRLTLMRQLIVLRPPPSAAASGLPTSARSQLLPGVGLPASPPPVIELRPFHRLHDLCIPKTLSELMT